MKRATATRQHEELKQFAAEFPDEARLREVVADLLRKMGRTGVRIVHGANERGKDILFYHEHGMGAPQLCACVVKNERITGSVSSVSSASNVLFQARQALAEPVPNGSGAVERVTSVFVIAPQEPAPAAIESIHGQLQERAGQVHFICGHALLELFHQYWPEFLCFESGLLTRYLARLCEGLEQDAALNSLLMRQNVTDSDHTLTGVYVQPRLEAQMHRFAVADLGVLLPRELSSSMRLDQIEYLQLRMRTWGSVLHLAELWAEPADVPALHRSGTSAAALPPDIRKRWEQQYAIEERTRSREQRAALAKRDVAVELSPPADLRDRYEQIATHCQYALERLLALIEDVNRFVGSRGQLSSAELINHEQFRSYCRLEDLSRLLPAVVQVEDRPQKTVQFEPSLIRSDVPSLLVTGPAGYGKTSFCRWNALEDARRIIDGEDAPLPLYIRLHQHAQGRLGSFEEVFLSIPEVRNLLARSEQGRHRHVRLYLDGLDEVASRKRQEDLVQLAKSAMAAYPNLQVVVTARDHVWGPWLGWLPRLHLSALDSQQVRQLAGRWLSGEAEVQSFLTELDRVPALAPLMSVPLLGTLIINLYRQTRVLPATKARLYRTFVELLSGGWDAAKQMHRGGRFGPEDKITVLTRLAMLMQRARRRDAGEELLRSAIRATLASFEIKWDELLAEVLEDGLLVRSGHLLMFSHQSFQEFLAARDVHNDPTGRNPKQVLSWFLRGDDWWREVVAFYVGIGGAPQEIRAWMMQVADHARQRADNVVGGDFKERLDFVARVLAESFPGTAMPAT